MPENPVYSRDDGHFIYLATVELGYKPYMINSNVAVDKYCECAGDHPVLKKFNTKREKSFLDSYDEFGR
jgi:hypothetical protein